MAEVWVPPRMQALAGGQKTLRVPGSTIRQLINNMDKEYPGMKEQLVDKFKLKANITVAVDGEVTPLGILEKVGEDSEVHFLPAIAGG